MTRTNNGDACWLYKLLRYYEGYGAARAVLKDAHREWRSSKRRAVAS